MWGRCPHSPARGIMPLAPHGDSDMKYIAMFLLCMVLAAPCFAGSCQDMQDAVGGAIQERNGRVSDTHDILMPDPETERDALSGCLGSVNAIGDAFSLGVTLPSMDQIVAGMCSQVNPTSTGKSTRLTIRSTTPSTAWAATIPSRSTAPAGIISSKLRGNSNESGVLSSHRSVAAAGCGLCR